MNTTAAAIAAVIRHTQPATASGQLSSAARDWALLLLPGLIWGTSFLLIAEALETIPPDGITFLRFVIGFITLAAVPAARQPVLSKDRAGIAALGVIWMALPMSMFPHAEQHVSSALTGMLNGALPLIAAIVAAAIARTAPSRSIVVGLAVGFAGAVVMAAPGLGADGSSRHGVLLILVALVSYGIAINLAKPLQQRNGALPVVWRALLVAMLVTAPLGVPAVAAARWRPAPVAALVALGVFGTAIANVVMAVAAGRLGAARASATTFLIPVVALMLGVLVRSEHVPALAIGGGALCLAGAWLMRRAAAK